MFTVPLTNVSYSGSNIVSGMWALLYLVSSNPKTCSCLRFAKCVGRLSYHKLPASQLWGEIFLHFSVHLASEKQQKLIYKITSLRQEFLGHKFQTLATLALNIQVQNKFSGIFVTLIYVIIIYRVKITVQNCCHKCKRIRCSEDWYIIIFTNTSTNKGFFIKILYLFQPYKYITVIYILYYMNHCWPEI